MAFIRRRAGAQVQSPVNARALVLAVLALSSCTSLPATIVDPADIEAIEYEPAPNNLFPGLETAELIVDHFHSEGVSTGDRYWYEVIVADRTLRLHFHSPGTASYGRVQFETSRELSHDQAADIRTILHRAGLTQRKQGIPRPSFSGHTKDVLFVRSKSLQIAGGMFHSNIFPDSASPRAIASWVKEERAATSSIGGDYEAVFKALRKLFVELDGLLRKSRSR